MNRIRRDGCEESALAISEWIRQNEVLLTAIAEVRSHGTPDAKKLVQSVLQVQPLRIALISWKLYDLIADELAEKELVKHAPARLIVVGRVALFGEPYQRPLPFPRRVS